MNIRTLIEQHFPPRCLLCQAENGPLCPACLGDLPWQGVQCCPICALPTPNGESCGHCLKQRPEFSRTQALFSYQFPLDRLVQQLKYQEQLTLAPLLGQLLAARLELELPELWLPMPLHARRLQERGFNQAVEITRALAATTGIPMQPGWTARVRDTPPQAGLKREARKRNLRGAFRCCEKVSGLRVGIVDDVMTTGSTLDELAKTLKAAGAKEVVCLVVARA